MRLERCEKCEYNVRNEERKRHSFNRGLSTLIQCHIYDSQMTNCKFIQLLNHLVQSFGQHGKYMQSLE